MAGCYGRVDRNRVVIYLIWKRYHQSENPYVIDTKWKLIGSSNSEKTLILDEVILIKRLLMGISTYLAVGILY